MINCLHHFEILTNSSQKLLNYFIKGFNFNLIKTSQSGLYKQYLLNSNSINFLLTSIESSPLVDQLATNNSLELIKKSNINLYDSILSKQNTVFNAAFQVKSIDTILSNCIQNNVKIVRDKQLLYDTNYGYVEHAIIESCIDGVIHSLIDSKEYNGKFLPGFESKTIKNALHPLNLTHFDHLTYAIDRNQSKAVIDWYSNIFNMKRFMLNKEQNDGLLVKTGNSGMNLKCINYWMCAETGVDFNNTSEQVNDFKFVISEPLDDGVGPKNQISIFLDENNGPGIQHIGLNSTDIIKTVSNSKMNHLDIQYYSTPDEYYSNKDKKEEIHRCGLDMQQLKVNHILLDADLDQETSKLDRINTFLLQVFTQPIFDKNTVFLELIQRVGNAQGFGAGNIKALWNAVQRSIHNVQIKLKKRE